MPWLTWPDSHSLSGLSVSEKPLAQWPAWLLIVSLLLGLAEGRQDHGFLAHHGVTVGNTVSATWLGKSSSQVFLGTDVVSNGAVSDQKISKFCVSLVEACRQDTWVRDESDKRTWQARWKREAESFLFPGASGTHATLWDGYPGDSQPPII
jgi:hypothetical protein